jgi:hypothetical protein
MLIEGQGNVRSPSTRRICTSCPSFISCMRRSAATSPSARQLSAGAHVAEQDGWRSAWRRERDPAAASFGSAEGGRFVGDSGRGPASCSRQTAVARPRALRRLRQRRLQMTAREAVRLIFTNYEEDTHRRSRQRSNAQEVLQFPWSRACCPSPKGELRAWRLFPTNRDMQGMERGRWARMERSSHTSSFSGASRPPRRQ